MAFEIVPSYLIQIDFECVGNPQYLSTSREEGGYDSGCHVLRKMMLVQGASWSSFSCDKIPWPKPFKEAFALAHNLRYFQSQQESQGRRDLKRLVTWC